VRHGHPEDGQLVRFPRQRTTSGHHVAEFIDVGRHLVPSPPLNLAMALSTKIEKNLQQCLKSKLVWHSKKAIK
jgi:hypothetical protein